MLKQINEKDEALIGLLQVNARESISNLARRLGVSRTAVQERLKRLQRAGVIEGFTLKLNPDWHKSRITTFITLVVEPKHASQVIVALERRSAIMALWTVSGRFDLLAVASAATTEKIDQLLDDIGTIEGIVRTESSVLLSTKFERR